MHVEVTQQPEDVLVALAVALACGLIVGFERGWRQRGRGADGDLRAGRGSVDADANAVLANPPILGEPDAAAHPSFGRRAAGIRTFALTSLLGGLIALLSSSPWPLAAGLLALAGLLVASYFTVANRTGDVGITTEVALLVTFLLGAVAASGRYLDAAGVAVVTALLLGMKEELHTTLGRLHRSEVQASLQLLLIAVVVVPLLPDQQMGPWGSLNPRTIGLLVMLIAGIGFVGYFAVRVLGTRAGLLLTAALGGITSSTAVTLSFARLSRRHVAPPVLLGAGIALASGIMGPRLIAEVAAVNPALLPAILPGALMLAAVPLAATGWILWSGRSGALASPPPDGVAAATRDLALENPLELRQACVMGALLALIFVLAAGAREIAGDSGVYVLAVLSGVVDVDAVALTLAEQARRDLPADTAVRAILLAALVNTLVKAVYAAVIGGLPLARSVVVILGFTALACAATLPFISGLLDI